MPIKIRQAQPKDFERLEQILTQNDMLEFPKIDGEQAMQRVYELMGKYFLVAEIQEISNSDNYIVGVIRGCYDGSRAVIHQLAVDKKYQKQGIGKKLIFELASKLKSDKALSISATSHKQSEDYYKSLGFADISINLMVCLNINKIIEKTNQPN